MSHSKENFPRNPKLIFMGTPDFAVPTLEALIEGGYDIHAVVTQPNRPKGRGKKMAAPPIKALAVEKRLKVLQPEKASDPHFCELIKGENPDLIIVVAFGQILKKNLLEIPHWGVLNIHASLLPEYRGAAPIQRAIMNNEQNTGLTIMQMDEGLDTGPILFQEKVPIMEDETAGQLHDRLAAIGGGFMVRFLRQTAGKPLSGNSQDGTKATYAGKIERRHCLIDWRDKAVKVCAHIRGLDPIPGARTILDSKELKLFSATVVDEGRSGGVPGTVLGHEEKRLLVQTGKGIVGMSEIQYPGKKRLPVVDFLRGFSLPEGTVFGVNK